MICPCYCNARGAGRGRNGVLPLDRHSVEGRLPNGVKKREAAVVTLGQ